MAWNGLTILNALADGPRLTRQIAAASGVSASSLKDCLKMLRGRGLILTVEGNHQLTEAGREAHASGKEITSGPCNGQAVSRHAKTLRSRAWRAMRIRDGFSLDDLLTMLCDGTEADAERNLRTYILALVSAGYLMPLPKRGENPLRRWRLRRDHDTGPEAPAWNKKTRTLTDHNTGKTVIIPRKREVRHAA